MNIGSTIYQTLVRYAEGGERITKVVLPSDLFVEYLGEQGMVHLMRTLGVEVVEGKVAKATFHTGEAL